MPPTAATATPRFQSVSQSVSVCPSLLQWRRRLLQVPGVVPGSVSVSLEGGGSATLTYHHPVAHTTGKHLLLLLLPS